MRADAVVLRLPTEVLSGLPADVLVAALAGGAFAAFISTSSGLAVAVTGVLNQDVVRPLLARLSGGDHTEVSGFRIAAVVAVVVPFGISRFLPEVPLAAFVTLAFVVAASTFFPLLSGSNVISFSPTTVVLPFPLGLFSLSFDTRDPNDRSRLGSALLDEDETVICGP